MTVQSQTPIELVKSVYSNLEDRLSSGRKALGRPLTLAEKILINHLENPTSTEMNRGVSYVDLHPDRVAMQDATAQMAWLQFMTAGLEEVQVPTTTHCDHLIQARIDGDTDLSLRLTIIPRCMTSLNRFAQNTERVSGNPAPVSFTKSFSNNMLFRVE